VLEQTQHDGAVQVRHSLLVAVCRRDLTKDLGAVDVAPLGDDRFRREFLDIASSHRVLGLALSVISRAWAHRGLAAYGTPFDDLLRKARRRAAVYGLQRDRVVTALLSRGVRPVILKGTALAITIYDEPCDRDLLDLDILVREDQLEQSEQVLGAQGYRGPTSPETYLAYRRRHFHIPLERSNAHIVELHWALTMPGAPFQLDATEVLAQSTPLERRGQPVLFLPRPEHTLLHIVIENLQEGFSRLSRLVDVDRIVASTPGMDWELVVAAAREGNLTSAAAESLELGRRLLGTTVPDGVLRELRPGPVARFHLAIMRPDRSFLSRRCEGRRSTKDLHELWLVGGVRKRLLLLRQMLVFDPAITFPRKTRPGVLVRLWRLGKLFAVQLFFYIVAAVDQVTPFERTETRSRRVR